MPAALLADGERFENVDMKSESTNPSFLLGIFDYSASPTSEALIDRTLRSDLNIPDHLKASAKHMIR